MDVTGEPLVGATAAPGAARGRGAAARPAPTWRRRRVVFAASLAAVVVAGLVVWRSAPGGRAGASPADATTAGLVPRVSRQGTFDVLPLTLLDGRRVDLRYPASLGIADLGMTLTAWVRWPVSATPADCCWALVSASHATLAQAYGSTRPSSTYPVPHGAPVRLFSAAARRLPPGFSGQENLAFQFGPWLVEVGTSAVGFNGGPPAMSAQDQRLLAADLGATASHNSIVLRTLPPLALAPPGVIDRTAATFGLGYPNEPQRNVLEITDGECVQPTASGSRRLRFQAGDGRPGVEWCEPNGLHITAIGLQSFVDGVASSLSLDG